MAYEWWCPRCRVTHPPGRKECVHCGGRVQPTRDPAPAFDPRALLEGRMRLPGAPGHPTAPGAPGAPGAPDVETDDDTAPASSAGRAARIGMTVLWIALAIGASLLRMCQEQPP